MTTDPSNPFENHPALEKLTRLGDPHAEAIAVSHAKRKEELEAAAVEESIAAFWETRGKRYRDCTLDNFQVVSGSLQDTLLNDMRIFAAHIDDEIHSGTNLLLAGDPGTGKDHLVAALMTLAMERRHSVKWTSGAMLFARFRDAIGAEEDERWLMGRYTKPAVLVISDPAWEREPLTRYQREKLGAIIDIRYNHLHPLWITLNARDRGQANELLGKALVDRLRHGAISRDCKWPSYRKPR